MQPRAGEPPRSGPSRWAGWPNPRWPASLARGCPTPSTQGSDDQSSGGEVLNCWLRNRVASHSSSMCQLGLLSLLGPAGRGRPGGQSRSPRFPMLLSPPTVPLLHCDDQVDQKGCSSAGRRAARRARWAGSSRRPVPGGECRSALYCRRWRRSRRQGPRLGGRRGHGTVAGCFALGPASREFPDGNLGSSVLALRWLRCRRRLGQRGLDDGLGDLAPQAAQLSPRRSRPRRSRSATGYS